MVWRLRADPCRPFSGEPWDVAICSCVAASFYRKGGADTFNLVRQHLTLTPDQRVAWLEDFDGDDADADPREGQRARAFVYALRVGDVLKIGMSTNLARRYQDLCSQRGQDGQWIGRAGVRSLDHARVLERWLQHRYGPHRLDREWFRADPAFVQELRTLFADHSRIAEALKQAIQARAELRPDAAIENSRVIRAVAVDVVKAAPPTAPAWTLLPVLMQRCQTLKIRCNEEVAKRALRGAAYLLGREREL